MLVALLVLAFTVGLLVGYVISRCERPKSPRFVLGYDVVPSYLNDAGKLKVLAKSGDFVVEIARLDPKADDFEEKLAVAKADAISRGTALAAGLRR